MGEEENNKPDVTSSDYIINWRNSLWTSIREKESICWKFLGLYVSVIAAILGLTPESVPPEATVMAVYLITSWGIITSIDANYWNRRNIKIVSAIETDTVPYVYSRKYLPVSYSKPGFVYLLTFRTSIHVLTIALMLCMIWFSHRLDSQPSEGLSFYRLLVFGSLALSYWVMAEDHERRRQFKNFVNNTRNTVKNGEEPSEVKIFSVLRSPVTYFAASTIQLAGIISYSNICECDVLAWMNKDWLIVIPFGTLILSGILSRNINLKNNALLVMLRFVILVFLTLVAILAGLLAII